MKLIRCSNRSRIGRAVNRQDDGFVAVMVAILMPVIFGITAFSVDVANWYSTIGDIQRAADAAALAGVPYMPSDLAGAKAQALATATANGFTDSSTVTVDPEPVSGNPSQLQVTITKTVDNTFLQIFGQDTTTIRRTAIATYQAPLPMGSPCNEYGNGPDPLLTATSVQSSNCTSTGQFWANVGSPKAAKSYGDAYQDGNCATSAAGTDNCSDSNSDYSSNGYFYQIKLSAAVSNLTIQAFDPAFVSVGDTCASNFGSGSTAAVYAKNQYNYDASTSATAASYTEDSNLYGSGSANQYCTGDMLYTDVSDQPPDTTYTIRQQVASSNPWDPTSYPVVGSCTQTFTGFSGDLYTALNQYKQDSNNKVQYAGGSPQLAAAGTSGYNATVASEFRQWVTLCTFDGTASAGTYFVQVQTNAAADNSNGDGHNRFSIRAFGSNASDDANIEISGYTFMGVYANLPSAQTTFYLTQVPPAAAGQILDLRFFDIGDSEGSGTVTVEPPSDSNASSFSGCVGSGPTSGALSGCSIPANSTYNGKWETISIPIPAGYTCDSASPTGCWITLTYNYGSGNQPSDTTSWAASLEGTPVRITT
ncbi:MAG: pilus assembly protein TadG-related protein [Gordonia sp. (in: high G+C Gram-positive bacteria)]